MFWHKVEQVDEAHEIVAIVEQRLLNALAHCLACSEMDDALDVGIFGEYLVHALKVAAINLLEGRTHTCDLLYAINNICLRV